MTYSSDPDHDSWHCNSTARLIHMHVITSPMLEKHTFPLHLALIPFRRRYVSTDPILCPVTVQ